MLYQFLPEFFLTRSIVRAEVVFAVNIVDDDDPVFVERSIVADVAVSSGESLCGEEHAGVVGQVHHYVGLLGVGEVDASLTVQQVFQMWVPVSDYGHLLPRHHSHMTHQLQVEIYLQGELVVVLAVGGQLPCRGAPDCICHPPAVWWSPPQTAQTYRSPSQTWC